MRRPVIAGNWKMHKTIGETVDFIETFRASAAKVDHCDILVAPPFTALRAAADSAKGSNIGVAAQDVHWAREGAHTGDVSAAMLVDAGCSHVIIGHSERRQHHGETDEQVNRKLKAAIASGLIAVVCVGELLAEREAGSTQEILSRQFQGGLAGLTAPELSRMMMAYEPVWAIGTGRTATPEIAAETHYFLRELARNRFGERESRELRILYGGSVKPDNIAGLMAQKEIDGVLVGGASLDVKSFSAIVNYQRA
jgi:triosephosphate isomerase